MLRGCTRCNRMLPFTAFSKHKKKRDGLQPRCKSCVKYTYHNTTQSKIIAPTKVCTQCNCHRPSIDFSPHKGRLDGLQSSCKICRREIAQERRAEKPIYLYQIKRLYGMNAKEYQALLDQQSSSCAICKKPHLLSRLCVDHNHATNKVRGLLCDGCNKGLGFFKDRPDLLKAALTYLGKGDGK